VVGASNGSVVVVFPFVIGGDGGEGVVIEFDFELEYKAAVDAPDSGAGNEADVANVPAVAEYSPDNVFAMFKEIGDIVSLVLDSVVVVSPFGCEDVIADAISIKVEDIFAEGGGVEESFFYIFTEMEFKSK